MGVSADDLKELIRLFKSYEYVDLKAVLLGPDGVDKFSGELEGFDVVEPVHPSSDVCHRFVTVVTDGWRLNHLTEEQVGDPVETFWGLRENVGGVDGRPRADRGVVPYRG